MQTTDTIANEICQFCTFRIAQRLFGLKVADVKEIHPVVNFTPVFHATEDVKGFVNIRGQVCLIIDLRKLLGFESKTMDELSQIVMFKPYIDESFGVLVDSISDVVKTNLAHIEMLGKTDHNIRDKSLHHFSDLVEVVCKLENELLMILNSQDLLGKIEAKQKR